MGLSDANMTTADTMPDINNPPPINDPTARNIPSSSPEAAMAVITSGAPFPKASKVTPASDSLKPKVIDIFANAGLK